MTLVTLVTLVSQGREPRRALVFRPALGAKQTVTAIFSSTVSVESGGQSKPAPPTPATKMTFKSQVQSITPEGEIRYDFTIDSVELLVQAGTPVSMIDDVKSSVAILPGLQGKGVAGRDGSSLELDLPASVPAHRRNELAELASSLRFVGSPFPREPVGPGARWEQPLYGQGPVPATGSARFELVSFDGERALTRVLVQQTSRPQPVPREYKTRADGAERMVVRSQTKAETLFGLDRLWPVHSELETRTQTDLTSEKEEPPRRLRVITLTQVRME